MTVLWMCLVVFFFTASTLTKRECISNAKQLKEGKFDRLVKAFLSKCPDWQLRQERQKSDWLHFPCADIFPLPIGVKAQREVYFMYRDGAMSSRKRN